MKHIDRTRAVVALAAALAAFPAVAQQNYPTRPIRVLLPVPPGSGVDLILRKAGVELQPRLGQPFVVENHASANMVTGADACAKAANDGYTICGLSASSLSFSPNTIRKLPYDADKDFTPIVNMFFLQGGILVKAALPVKSMKELQAYAQKNPGKLNFGTLGPGSTTDISRQWLEELWHTRIVGIPYKGGPAVVRALVNGESDLARIGAYNAIPLIKSGKVKIFALDATERSPVLPNVPTMAEEGLDEMPPDRAWWGVLAPAGVSNTVVQRLNREFVQLFKKPSFKKFLDSMLVEVATGTPDEFAAFIRKDREYARRLVVKYHVPIQ
jgi:tripartite-type tricarboxylate transporter receptor subunit TctC